MSEGYDARGLKRFMPAGLECLITDVEVFASDTRRRIIIRGEAAKIEIETSAESGEVAIRADRHRTLPK
jgi:hypothetical protein